MVEDICGHANRQVSVASIPGLARAWHTTEPYLTCGATYWYLEEQWQQPCSKLFKECRPMCCNPEQASCCSRKSQSFGQRILVTAGVSPGPINHKDSTLQVADGCLHTNIY